MNTTKPWDDSMKLLVRQDPQSLVSFLVPDAVFEGVEDRKLQAAPSVTSDSLYRIMWQQKPIILHVEFQVNRDEDMGHRLWHYNALTHVHTKLPVHSVVIYLREDGPLVQSPHVIWLPDGRPTQRLDFETIKLWEVAPEVIEQPQLVGLLPLLPLTKGGKNRQTVMRMIDKLKKVGKRDLIVVGYACSCLAFPAEDELAWLKERFFEMQDILRETWVFQEITKQGSEEGRKEEFLQFVEIRFPLLLAQAKQAVEQQTSTEQLRLMFNKFYRANTIEEAQAALPPND